jgi:L-lactate dehydrogenase complex protein LldG
MITVDPNGAEKVKGSGREIEERFAEMMEANGGWVIFTTAGDVAKEVALLVKGEGTVLVDPRLPGLAAELERLGVEAAEALPQASLGAVLPHAGAAVTTAVAGVAATGSVLVGPGAGNEGLLAVVPPHHVVVLAAGSIVSEIADALAKAAPLVANPGSRLVFVSGPSRTSDIELTTVLGVHGPLRLDVLVVAEGSEA